MALVRVRRARPVVAPEEPRGEATGAPEGGRRPYRDVPSTFGPPVPTMSAVGVVLVVKNALNGYGYPDAHVVAEEVRNDHFRATVVTLVPDRILRAIEVDLARRSSPRIDILPT